MPQYAGASLRDFAKAIEDQYPDRARDWSVELAYHLGKALLALERLRAAGVQVTYRQRELIEPALEDCWRGLVFIRQRYVPQEIVLNDVPRRVTLSKRGRIMVDDDPEPRKERLYRRPNSPKYRRRVVKKPTERHTDDEKTPSSNLD